MSTSYFSSVAELRRRLMLKEFPIKVTVADPISGNEVSIDKKDIYSSVIAMAGNRTIDRQAVPALFLEAARMQRGCERSAAQAEMAFAAWKAARGQEARAAAAKRSEKITDKAVEAAYRTHKDYESYAQMGPYYRALASLFQDLKDAYTMKARMIESISMDMRGYEKTEHAAELEESDSLDDLDEMAAKSIEEGRRKTSVAVAPPPPPPEEDEEEGEEEEEEAPPPRKRGRPRKAPPPPPEDEDEEEGEQEDEEEEAPPPRPKSTKSKKQDDEDEEEEEEPEESEEEDDEDEEEAPPPRRKPRKMIKDRR